MYSNYLLNRIVSYQNSPGKLLSCCKQFTVNLRLDVRWKNRIYFRDSRIKLVNCKDPHSSWGKCKELWYKEGKEHRDDIDPESGRILPAITTECLKQLYKYFLTDGKIIGMKIIGETNYFFLNYN
jgi:hypothetical protein